MVQGRRGVPGPSPTVPHRNGAAGGVTGTIPTPGMPVRPGPHCPVVAGSSRTNTAGRSKFSTAAAAPPTIFHPVCRLHWQHPANRPSVARVTPTRLSTDATSSQYRLTINGTQHDVELDHRK